MIRLPHWVVADRFPAFFESESATAIEMVAKLYDVVKSIPEDYNTNIDILMTELQNWEGDQTEAFNCFKSKIVEMLNDFITAQNIAFDKQNLEIAKAKEYMTTHIHETANAIIQQMMTEGILTLNIEYVDDTEALSLNIVSDVEV